MQQQVAVIGAGPAGLATARELLRAGHAVEVFEQQAGPGGVWIYDARTETDPLGLAPAERHHASLYAALRTNLPRDLMAFLDYPFDGSGGGEDHWPRFPGHAEVRTYLERFTSDHGLTPHVRFGVRVERVRRDGDRWTVEARGAAGPLHRSVDAVAVCNGHYAEPRIPALPGLDRFPGLCLHSHNYRHPDPFANRTVAVLGAAPSGTDIHRAVAAVARRVWFSATEFSTLPAAARSQGNVERVPFVTALSEDGTLTFADGSRSDRVDAVLFCTGYRFAFPFLDEGLLRVEDNWVQPLYAHLLHADHDSLACIGLPLRVIPFPLFALQGRWFAGLLRGDFAAPPPRERHRAVLREGARMAAAGRPWRHAHLLGDAQQGYYDRLAAQCGAPPLPDWFRRLAAAHYDNVRRFPTDYHDRPLIAPGPTRVRAGAAATGT